MAKLIPSLASSTRRMTSGERRFAGRLESHLEDDYLCWYDVPVGARSAHPDFVILNPRRGVLVLEVKDWRVDTIRRIDKVAATLLTERGEVRDSNPLEQARQCAHLVCRVLESDPALVGQAGTSYPGKLKFPWGYGAVLPNITRRAFMGTDLPQVIPPERVICQDEMLETVPPEELQRRLWGMFGVTFPCLLSLPEIERVRWHLFPEIRVAQGTFDLEPARAGSGSSVPDVIRVMDLQQEQLARSMGEGHRVIHGVAGSGKTMILGYRAHYLAQASTHPILVLCYNKSLAMRLQHMIEERGIEAKVSARTFHGWCADQIDTYQVGWPGKDREDRYERLVNAVIEGVERGQIPRGQYGAVLVDEGHDFEPAWLKLVAQMVHPDTNALLVLYDDAQSINKKRSNLGFSFAEVGIQARGRTTILRLNYRNTVEIMAVACAFANELLSAKEAEEDAIPLVAPESAGRHGPVPSLRQFAGEKAELDYIARQAAALRSKGSAWKDMAILVRYKDQGERIARTLAEAKIPFDFLGQAGRKFDPAADSVKVLTMHSSKGLEFPIVFLPGLDALPNKRQDPAAEAKLLYVAMTRATQQLHMTHRSKSVFTDRIQSAMASVPAR